ncbi:hypothetical protein EUGRSUZ_L02644 [Eucalyptus grandis]|uniref:Uncharacterized protein n=1 Tax=Eucalyptus grandis TaxID=71139 RepID=A0AAD9T8S4_EUCGR|nr:hypothetical protein EUGRSUZ_L02644 [Eucalyptus grandis]
MAQTAMWEGVDFAQIDGNYVEFSLTHSMKVKKWGFRIICEQLGNDLKVELQDNQLIDLALLYEVGHELTNSIAGSSLMHEDNSSEANLHEDLQDCQVSGEEQNQIVPKRNHELFSLEPWRELDKGAWDVHFDAGGVEGQLERERYKLPLEYTKDEGIKYERDARTQQRSSSKASQVTGYSGLKLDMRALILPVESSHAFALLGFHQGHDKESVNVQISFCPDVHMFIEGCSCDLPFYALT